MSRANDLLERLQSIKTRIDRSEEQKVVSEKPKKSSLHENIKQIKSLKRKRLSGGVQKQFLVEEEPVVDEDDVEEEPAVDEDDVEEEIEEEDFDDDPDFSSIEEWETEAAVDYFLKVVEGFGAPHEMLLEESRWYDIAGFDRVVIIDEGIEHEVPEPHYDFLYTTITLSTTPEQIALFAKISGNILVDPVKEDVTVRCGMLARNAIILGFCQDVVEGKIKEEEAASEYLRRLEDSVVPEWYDDILGELEEEEEGDTEQEQTE